MDGRTPTASALASRGVELSDFREILEVALLVGDLPDFHCLVAPVEHFLLVPLPNVIEHGIACVAEEGANELQRRHPLAVSQKTLHNVIAAGKACKVGEKLSMLIRLAVESFGCLAKLYIASINLKDRLFL